jgi:hypothetical protein
MDTIIAHYPPQFPPANCMLIRSLSVLIKYGGKSQELKGLHREKGVNLVNFPCIDI